MLFRPNVNDKLTIDEVTYRFIEHPAIPGTPFGQAGRRATVYQLAGDDGKLYALKVFYKAFRAPHIAESADRLRSFAKLPGLQVCERIVLTPDRHTALLNQYDDLVYAALMPWMRGELWQEVIQSRREYQFAPELSAALAHALVRILAVMELQQLAHCDLSGGNVIVVRTRGEVALIDVEDLYAPGLTQPTQLPGGSPGYAHREAPAGLWRAQSDRFAGLVLLGEILCWFDPRVRQQSYGEHFFDPQEMQRESPRLNLVREVLGARWGKAVLETFERGWFSQKLEDCASFQAWAAALNIVVPYVPPLAPIIITIPTPQQEAHELLRQAQSMLELGQFDQATTKLEAAYRLAPLLAEDTYVKALRRRAAAKIKGNDPRGALDDYRAALAITPAADDARAELEHSIAGLEQQMRLLPADPPQPGIPLLGEEERDQERKRILLLGEEERDQERKRILRSFMIVFTVVGVIVLLLAQILGHWLSNFTNWITLRGGPIIREILAGGSLALLTGGLYAWAFRSTIRKDKIWRIVLATGAAGLVGGLAGGLIIARLHTFNLASTAIASLVEGGLSGALAGFIQATIRLRASMARRRQWIQLGAVSWAIIWCFSLTVGAAIGAATNNLTLGDAIGWTLVLALNGSALALFGSLRRSLEV